MCGPANTYKQALPEGWTAHVDTEGRTYYANIRTGESSWDRPEVSPALPEGWSAHQDPEGRTFYHNAVTGDSTWTCPSWTEPLPEVLGIYKEFGPRKHDVTIGKGTPGQRLEEWLLCGGFFQQINRFVEKHAHKFNDNGEHSLESFSLFKEYEEILSARCETFLVNEGSAAEEVVASMLQEEEARGQRFKVSEYLMAAIDFEMFVSLMLDFQTGLKDVSRWWEVCNEEGNDWTWVPAE